MIFLFSRWDMLVPWRVPFSEGEPEPDKIISHRSRRRCFWGSTLVNCNVAILWSLGSPTYVLIITCPVFLGWTIYIYIYTGLHANHPPTYLATRWIPSTYKWGYNSTYRGVTQVTHVYNKPFIGVITRFGIVWLFGLFPTKSDLHPTTSWFKIYAVSTYCWRKKSCTSWGW